MAAKKLDHSLQLIVALSRVGEEGVVAACQEVLLRGSGAAGVPDEGEPIDARARQRTRRLHQGVDELHGFRILTGPQG